MKLSGKKLLALSTSSQVLYELLLKMKNALIEL